MKNKFSDNDKRFMTIALNEAEKALNNLDLPVGAVLVDDYDFVAKDHNSIFKDVRWTAHAEHKIFNKYSSYILGSYRGNNFKSNLTLYTTLEPCLMCYGTSLAHRVSKIVCACRDPYAGATSIVRKKPHSFYDGFGPLVEFGLFCEESKRLIEEFIKLNKTNSTDKLKDILNENCSHSQTSKKRTFP